MSSSKKNEKIVVETVMYKKGRKKDWYSIINPWAERRIQLLRSGSVKYYDGDRCKGGIHVIGAQVVERLPEHAENRLYAFEIISMDPKEPSLLLSAGSYREREVWMKCIKYVSTKSWDLAKEAERIYDARAMPFPVRIWVKRTDGPTSPLAIAPRNTKDIPSASLTETEEAAFAEKRDNHTTVWRNYLPVAQRKALESLRETLSTAVNAVPCGCKVEHIDAEGSSAYRRVFEDLSLRKASTEQSISDFIGFPANLAKDTSTFGSTSDVPRDSSTTPTSSPQTRTSSFNSIQNRTPTSPVTRKVFDINGPSTSPLRGGNQVGPSPQTPSGDISRISRKDMPYCVKTDDTTLLAAMDGSTSRYQPPDIKHSLMYMLTKQGKIEQISKLCENSVNDPMEIVESINKRNSAGQTALHAAMFYGRAEILRIFLKYDVDLQPHLSFPESHGQSPFVFSADQAAGETLIHAAIRPIPSDVPVEERELCKKGQVECLRILLKHMKEKSEEYLHDINIANADQKWTPLHAASWYGLEDHINVLLSIDEDERRQRNFLQDQVKNNDETEKSAPAEDEECTGLYLNVDEQDITGFSALHIACVKGHLQCVKTLVEVGGAGVGLEGGANFDKLPSLDTGRTRASSRTHEQIDVIADRMYTVFHLAAFAGHAPVLKYLLNLRPEQIPGSREKAIEMLASIKRKRYRNGNFDADATHMCALSGSVSCLTLCNEHKLFGTSQLAVHVKSDDSRSAAREAPSSTPLHLAALEGHLEAVQYLVRIGSNIHHQDHLGRVPVLEAARGGHVDVLNFLVSAGANVLTVDLQRQGALHLAVLHNCIDIVKVLIERFGLNIEQLDDEYNSPISIARKTHNVLLSRILSDHSMQGQPWEDFIPAVDNKRRGSYQPGDIATMAAAAAEATSGEMAAVANATAESGSGDMAAVANAAVESITESLEVFGEKGESLPKGERRQGVLSGRMISGAMRLLDVGPSLHGYSNLE